jgi:hypothetical protein
VYGDIHTLPPYEWARLSSFPTPVVVDDAWPSLFAAQREKSRLETQASISLRIDEIDRKVRAVMDTKQQRNHDLQRRYVAAQTTGAIHDAGLPDSEHQISRDVEARRPVNVAEIEWMWILTSYLC